MQAQKNIWDCSNTLMSLFDPSNPKNERHIQRSYETIASKIIINSRIWSRYIFFHATKQFFHFQYIQSILPSMPRNPWLWPLVNNLAMSSLFGNLKYSSKKMSNTAATNFFRLIIAMFSHILTYSSIKSIVTP